MRRDYFTLEVRNVGWVDEGGTPEKPTVSIDFDGPAESLDDRLAGEDGESLEATELDVAYRLQSPVDETDAMGVVAVTNRITGEFILELNADAEDVLAFIRAARKYGKDAGDTDGRYRIHIAVEGDEVLAADKRTFLVYDSDGSLLRQHSLIPSGVEL